MKFTIPFTFSDIDTLKRKNKNYAKHIKTNRNSRLAIYLKNSDAGLNDAEYQAICLAKFFRGALINAIVLLIILLIFNVRGAILIGIGGGFLSAFFVLVNRLNYPKLFSTRKTREVEKNLIPAMQDMLVQLNSGVPIFKIITSISQADYGAVSYEFRKAANEINSGKPQVEAIDDLGNRTNSIYFRRILWQISNGMRAGSDMSIVIKEGINTLTKEQSLQIQNYGNKLNPIIMFYMLLAVIMPALGLTFMTIIASMLNIPGNIVEIIFMGILVMVALIQVMFLGIIRTRRPSLL
jgi:flagellar protein FlaJ